MKALFLPSGAQCQTLPGETLLQAARRANLPIEASCGGRGACGKCRVRIVHGDCGGPHPDEAILSEAGIQAGYRLACRAVPMGDVTVGIPGAGDSCCGRKKAMAALPEGFAPRPDVRKVYLNLPKPTFEDQRSALARLIDGLGGGLYLDHRLLPRLSGMALCRGGLTAAVDGSRVMALEAGDTRGSCYGLAVDIGTTTAVAMLWDLNGGACLGTAARANPQGLYGADVISRIQYCNEGKGHLDRLQRLIIGCVNDMAAELAEKAGVSLESIYAVAAVGNTAMSHLFLGVHPGPLARSPFAPVFVEGQDRLAQELGLNVNPLANLHFLPNIAGHVGADITAALLSAGIGDMKGTYLAIDIGTNGEIALSRDGRILACSTAAGPAFEGASIHRGMRAAEGAIERVFLQDGDIAVSTIGGAPAAGICGSGLIDAVACLLGAGVIDPAGRMLAAGVRERGIPPAIAARLAQHEGKPAFLLEENVLLTQQDIREVQLAKGAIRAGAETLMATMGLAADDLDGVLLAGAFGSYIDKLSALAIGLLPDVPPGRITSVGNAAGAGASMALLSRECRKKAAELAAEVKHTELSANPDFQEAYIKAMGF